jgi:hypothetical protein
MSYLDLTADDVNAMFAGFTTENAANTLAEKKGGGFRDPNLYKPSIKDEKCVDKNYRALIRFIPFVNNNKVETTIERWESYLKDVNGENGIYVVSPKTIGKQCPIRNLSYRLYMSSSAIDKANSKKINVYQQWYSLIEVVKDAQHPEMEGKVYIFQFGKKIYDKIVEATKGSEYKDAFNPFDFFNARLFNINLTKGSQKMDGGQEVTNYDSCSFIEKTAPIHFGDGQTLTTDLESKKAFMAWLEEGAPKIKDYLFKEWDEETTNRVNTNLASYTSEYKAPETTASKTNDIINNIMNDAPAEAPKKKTTSTPKPEPKPEPEPAEDEITATDEDEDWVNSVLNG